MSEKRNKKDVLIRGVDEEAYRSLTDLAKRMRVSTGYLASESFRLLVALLDGRCKFLLVPLELARRIKGLMPEALKSIAPYVIKHVDKLRVSRTDLYSVKSPIIFFGVNELIFEDDVTEKDIDKKVLRIINCKIIEIPQHISKFLVLSKASFIGEIRVRSGSKTK